MDWPARPTSPDQFGPYELREGSWDTERNAYCKKVIRSLGEYAPNLEGSVEEMEVLAQPDIEDRVSGNIFQGEMSPDQLFSLRPTPGYGDYRSLIEGLWLCGSGTHPGGGVMAVPGRNAASVVLKDHRRDRILGRLRRTRR